MSNNDYKYLKDYAKEGTLFNAETMFTGITKNKNSLSFECELNNVGTALLKRLCFLNNIDTKKCDTKNSLYNHLIKNGDTYTFNMNIIEFVSYYFEFFEKNNNKIYSYLIKDYNGYIQAIKNDKYFFKAAMDSKVICLLFLLNERLLDTIPYDMKIDKTPVITKYIKSVNNDCYIVINTPLTENSQESQCKNVEIFEELLNILEINKNTFIGTTFSIDETINEMKKVLSKQGELNIYKMLPQSNIFNWICSMDELIENIMLDTFIHIYNFNEKRLSPYNQKNFHSNIKGKNLLRINKILQSIYNQDTTPKVPEDTIKQYKYNNNSALYKSISNLLSLLDENSSLIPTNERAVKQKQDDYTNRMDYFISTIFSKLEDTADCKPFASYEFAVMFQPLDFFMDYNMKGYSNIHPSEYLHYPVFTGFYLKKSLLETQLCNKIKDISSDLLTYESNNKETLTNDTDAKDIHKNILNEFKDLEYNPNPIEFYEKIISDDRYFKKTECICNQTYDVLLYADTPSQIWNMIIVLLGEYIMDISYRFYELLSAQKGIDLQEFLINQSIYISGRLGELWKETKNHTDEIIEKKCNDKNRDVGEARNDNKRRRLNRLYVEYFKRYFI